MVILCLVSCLLLYQLFRTLFIIIPKVAGYIVILVVGACCLLELIMGLLQLFGYMDSNHYLYTYTGSFDNPGTYGGFLSVCVSILGSFALKVKTKSATYIIGPIILLSTILMLGTISRAAIIALFCAIILWLISKKKVQIICKNGIWIICSLIVVMTGAYLYKKPSADGRLFMDKICIKAMTKNVLSGVGIGSFGGAYGNSQHDYFKKQIENEGKDVWDWTVINEQERLIADCPDNAFNEYLFIGVVSGPLVMFCFIGILITSIVVSFKKDTIWCYGLIAFAVFAMFSYPLHARLFQIMLPILIAASLSDGIINNNKKIIQEVSILSTIVIVLAFIVSGKLPEIRSYRHAKTVWSRTEQWFSREYYDYVVKDCETLLPYLEQNRHFLFAYGQSLNKTGNYVKSDSILKIGSVISSDPMFWNVMGNNSVALGHYREAEERYKHAFYIVPNRLYPLFLLAKLYHTEGDTARFLDMAERVEIFIPKVESIYTERLRAEIRELKEGYLTEFRMKQND